MYKSKLSVILFMSISILVLFNHPGYSQTKEDSLKAVLKNNPGDSETMLKLAVIYHDQGADGDKEAVKKSEQYLKDILDINPSNALAKAYLGSVYSMYGRDSAMPWNKIKHVKKGTAIMDSAVAMAPDDHNVRLVRAMNSLNLPGFLGRRKFCFIDFQYIIEGEKFQSGPRELKALVYYHYAQAFEKEDKKEESENYFKLAAETAPDSKWGKMASDALQNRK
ncbi:MAG: tetratricopeptide repeat protein [Calditrichaceae bacterium]